MTRAEKIINTVVLAAAAYFVGLAAGGVIANSRAFDEGQCAVVLDAIKDHDARDLSEWARGAEFTAGRLGCHD